MTSLRILTPLVGAVMLLAAGPAHAQSAGEDGTYRVYGGLLSEGDVSRDVTILVDSASGRTWMLTAHPEHGATWKRIPLVKLEKLPEGLLGRPTTITPTQPAQ